MIAALAAAACGIANVDLGAPVPSDVPPLLPLTGACSATPVALAHLTGIEPQLMAMDGANVYVVASATNGDSEHHSLWRVPKTGAPPELLADHQNAIGGIDVGSATPRDATSATAVFWTTGAGEGGSVSDAGTAGAVWILSAAAPSPMVLAANRLEPSALLVVGQRVYWSEKGIDAAGRPFGAIVWSATTGGAVTMLQKTDAQHVPHTFDALGDVLFWTTFDPALRNQDSAEVVSAPLPLPFGVTTRISDAKAGGATAIEVTLGHGDPTFFYSGPTGITGVTLTNSPRQFIPTSGFVHTLEEDGADVYFVEPATGKLMGAAVDSDAQAPRTIASAVDPETAFQVDESCVYWIDAHAEKVTMVHK